MKWVSANLLLIPGIILVTSEWEAQSRDVSNSCHQLRQRFNGANNIAEMFSAPTVNTEHPLAFLHIPKNAGSAVFRVFGRLRIRDDEYTNAEYPECNNRHVPPRYWKPKNPFSHHKVFCIIRDPVEKAISEFKMRNAGTLNNNDVVQRLERWLTKQRDWEKGGIDCHMVPQYLYVWDEQGNATCNHLIRYENNDLVNDYNNMLSAYPQMKKKKKMKNASNVNHRYHNIHHEAIRKPLNSINLSISVLRSVRQYYWQDMCLFGYDTSFEGT